MFHVLTGIIYIYIYIWHLFIFVSAKQELMLYCRSCSSSEILQTLLCFFFLVFYCVSDPSLIFLKITWELLLLWRLCLHVQKPVCTYSCLCRLRIHILVSIQVIHEHPGGVRVFISCCDSLPARIWQVGDSATLSSPNNQRVNKLKQKWVTTMSN